VFNQRTESSTLPTNVSFRLFLDEIHASNFVGNKLRQQVQEIISGTSFSPMEMLESLEAFSKSFGGIVATVYNVRAALATLGVEIDHVADGEYELGALFPRDVIGESLNDLTKKFDHLNRLVSAIMELQGAAARSPRIRTISASWWQVFLDLQSEAAVLVLVVALEKIVALYKSNLEIKKLRNELAKNDLSPEITALIDAEIEKKVEAGIEAIATDVRKKANANVDQARANGLEVQRKLELKHVARRLNQGAAYEVVAGPPQEPAELNADQLADPLTAESYKSALSAYDGRQEATISINARGAETHLLSSSDSQEMPLLITDEPAAHEQVPR